MSKKNPAPGNQQPLKGLLMGLFLIGFLLYANTLQHEYVLDDKIVIANNQITKKGFSGIVEHFKYDAMDGFWAESYNVDVKDLKKSNLVGGGRYRPLTLASHSLVYGIFGRNPTVGHFLNAALYGLTGMMLFLLLRLWFPNSGSSWYWNVPMLTTLIYLVHPLHTEVVANIKGRDELLSFLFAIIGLYFAFKHISKLKSVKWLGLSALFFGLSLFSKETTFPFFILLPLSIYFFKDVSRSTYIKLVGSWALVAVAYLIVRFSVLGTDGSMNPGALMNNPFILASAPEKWATIAVSLLAYVKLLVVPYPLTHDYYPFHLPFLDADAQYATWSHPAAFLSIVVHFILLGAMVYGFRKKAVYSFLILWYFGTLGLVANVLFPVGVFMNERFLYIPSFALALGMVYYLVEKSSTNAPFRLLPKLVIGAVVLVFSVLTVVRNEDWKSDYSLAMADVNTSKGSAKVKMSAGLQLMQRAEESTVRTEKEKLLNEAITYLKPSLAIHPAYAQSAILLGKAYYRLKDYKNSSIYFLKLASFNPGFEQQAALTLSVLNARKLMENGEVEAAIPVLNALRDYYPNASEPLTVLGEAYGRYLNKPAEAERVMRIALEMNPNNADALMNLGTLKAQLGEYRVAVEYFERAVKIVPNNRILLQNLAAVHYQLGNQQEYKKYAAQLEAQKNK